jgi:acetyl esterase
MALHPEALDFLQAVHDSGEPPLYELSPVEARAAAHERSAGIGAGPEVETVSELAIPVRGAEIAGRRYAPHDARGTIVWLHGGGWVLEGLDLEDAMCRMLAESSGASVVGVDYRVAPEHPFPIPVDDCFDALCWVAAGLEGSGEPLIVGGDSAGGNMAAVCALRARDRGGPALAAQVLVYPVTDHDMTTPSYLEHGANEMLLLESRSMRWFWEQYVHDVATRDNPDASPLRAPDLSGLAPAIVVVAEYDPLRDETVAYAERLGAAGVDVSVHRYDDMPHAFFSFVNLFKTGNEAVARVGAELREIIAAAPAAAAG